MIEPFCFSEKWILNQREQLPGADPTLLEKTILAFELLGRLEESGLRFVFKGGTSLLLLMKDFKRLSIDVDIVCEEGEKKLENVFNGITDSIPFKRWGEDPRKASSIPKIHYKFFFDSRINKREDYVLLDILRSGNLFPKVQKLPVALDFIHVQKAAEVRVPTLNSLIGDKLTAFAPHTIGVPLLEKRSMEVIKQLFDLGELFVRASDVREIAASYRAFAQEESRYRGAGYGFMDTLQDTLDACFLITQLDLKKSVENEDTKLLRRGIRQIQSHLIGTPFGLMQAKIAASRVALLAIMLRKGVDEDLGKIFFQREYLEKIKRASITGKWAILNRIKSTLPEAFYYWHLADKFDKG